MKYNYFLASRYRNKDAVLDLVQRIRKKGKTVYCFIESDASIKHVGKLTDDAEKSISRFEAIKNWKKDSAVREIFTTDMDALKDSEALIMLLPAGKSVHLEAGAAYGFGKKCILIGEQKETESLYLIFDEFYPTPEEFIKSLD